MEFNRESLITVIHNFFESGYCEELNKKFDEYMSDSTAYTEAEMRKACEPLANRIMAIVPKTFPHGNN